MSGAEERELLEWAAKAAGYTGRVEFSGLTDECFFAFGMSEQNPRGLSTWNPRHDDGDCARMEAALGLDVRWFGNSVAIHWTKTPGNMGWDVVEKESFLRTASVEQRASAKRLAAVRAAAAIGKAMP